MRRVVQQTNADVPAVVVTPPAWPNALDVVPGGRCRFTVAPPRHFLYPGVLLLLAEESRHGYALVEALNDLGLGRMDRSSVYRVLADLEADGYVLSWDEPPTAGTVRHVYSITRRGEQVLESWMSVVSQERSCLDLVLQRYWYSNARRLPELDGIDVASRKPPNDGVVAVSDAPAYRSRFEVTPNSSSVVVEARSNIGPIAFSTTTLRGWVEVELRDGLIQEDAAPAAHLEVLVNTLSSGNALYDAELLRRVDSRRFPTVILDLGAITRLGVGNCYHLSGDVTLHGVVRRLDDVVTATAVQRRRDARPGTAIASRRLTVTGEYVLDIRNFDLAIPKMALFKIYPDVRLHLRLEADDGS